MELNVPIKDIMKERLITLHPNDDLEKANLIFREFEIHHIPVVVMNEIVGILSQGDILFLKSIMDNSFDEFYKEREWNLMQVNEIMTSNPICLDINSHIGDAVKLMTEHRINALPVTEDKELRGLVTSYDVMHHIYNVINS
jgi:CBS domain-containing protein